MEDCLSQILTLQKKYILYFRRTKAITSVNSSDGFSLVVVNNTLLATNNFYATVKGKAGTLPSKKNNHIFDKNHRHFRQTHFVVTNVLLFDK